MEQVISNFADIAAGIAGAVIQSIPAPDTPAYFLMLGIILVLLALLCALLLIRLRRARLAKAAEAAFGRDVTFDDISAEAAASQPREESDAVDETNGVDDANAQPQMPPLVAEKVEPVTDNPKRDDLALEAEMASGEGREAPAGGFRFFKRKAKSDAGMEDATSPDDDVFLLGLEQEMLATRQLYLDGLITKEVYVTETRALYDKAQSRMS